MKTQTISHDKDLDLLMLGGLSIIVWAVLVVFSMFRGDSELLDSRFLQVPLVFAWLSFFCNFPHFMASYKIAYSRGRGFITENWFQLILVPIALVALYVVAYFFFHQKIDENPFVLIINKTFAFLHSDYRVGLSNELGVELMVLSVRSMYVLAGWHYAKQVFGCMLITFKMDQFQIKNSDRNFLKYTLFSIAVYNFFFSSVPAADASSISYFYNLPVESLGFGQEFLFYTKAISIILSVSLPVWFYYRYSENLKNKFPLRAAVIYLAFIVWWLPPVRNLEYTLYAIPFFHSLQYLLFAAKIEGHQKMSFKFKVFQVSILVISGYLFFEFIPNILDISLSTVPGLGTIFFYIAFPVFINIHHFFIDSCIWKMSNVEVREKIFSQEGNTPLAVPIFRASEVAVSEEKTPEFGT